MAKALLLKAAELLLVGTVLTLLVLAVLFAVAAFGGGSASCQEPLTGCRF